MQAADTLDTGTGYGRQAPTHDARLTEVGPGTPMGEAMRRYWHPVASSAELKSDVPHKIRVLGEDLVVFRDKQGRAGVVFERCAHRGTSLYYGRIEDDGIRCCYHGWKFDVEGRCIEQPCEPERRRHRGVVRQPWYPVEERYGLVFVYMGPPNRKPLLPRYAALEPLHEDQHYFSSWPVPGFNVIGLPGNFNWLQLYENSMDSAHATWLHHAHSGAQFAGTGTTGFPDNYYDPYTFSQRASYRATEFGTTYTLRFHVDDPEAGRTEIDWKGELHVPNIVALSEFVDLKADVDADLTMIWDVPSDDTSHRMFFAIRSDDPERRDKFVLGIKQDGKLPFELTEEDRQKFPGDAEAQGSQGPITLHSEENLVSSDTGVVLIRRALSKMVADVEAGRDPVGWSQTDDTPRHMISGNFKVRDMAGEAALADA